MPYCTKCGTKLDDDSKFCDKCGTPLSTQEQSNSIQPSFQSSDNNNSESEKVLFDCGYSNKSLTILIFTIIAVLLIAFYFISDLNGKIDDTHISDVVKVLKFRRNFLIVIYAVLILELIVKCIQLKNNHLRIFDKHIYGEACPLLGFGTIVFSLEFKQIRNVEIKSGNRLVITSNSRKYYCFLEDPHTAYRIIQDHF